MKAGPRLSVHPPFGVTDGATEVVVLFLPGGRVDSFKPVRPWNLSWLRMISLAEALRRDRATRGVAVALLQYRVRGWNGAQAFPVPDVRWALGQLRERFGGAPVVLLGHSMGGRAALAALTEPDVVAVVALAPWLPPDEPRLALGFRRLLVVHGTADRWTDPTSSREYVEAAKASGGDATWVPIPGVGHFMLRRRRQWREPVSAFVAELLDQAREERSASSANPDVNVPGQTGTAAAPNLAAQDADLG
jgi:pimeloyl-ACP methyl ester carboxylesterase